MIPGKYRSVSGRAANNITKIENVNHLCDLRVLNLARNLLSHVDNLNGLDSLTELNLRHNQITFVRDVDNLPCLQRLFLSFNNISREEKETVESTEESERPPNLISLRHV
ncbi:hypothetical protein A6R68_18058, partial [Neotoma lepida]